ncbi:hypothetical protein MASR2M70_00540 [Bacillota bacterium]
MYWGSVRFYKHLILLTFALVLIGTGAFATAKAIDNSRLRDELKAAKTDKLEKLLYLNQKEASYAWQIVAQNSASSGFDHDFDLEYQNLYPELNVGEIPEQTASSDTVYLTFDDGPSPLTENVLDILKDKGIKATFFVIGKNLDDESGKRILKRIVEEGHGIGIHSYSHVYKSIYASVGNYLDDFYATYNRIYDITGVRAEIFRFPGGSINGYSSAIYKEIIAEMLRRGFVYYDWNVSSLDAAARTTTPQIYNSVVRGAGQRTRSIVLMHDSSDKRNTMNALPEIIDHLTTDGYRFDIITRNVAPIIFGYSD